MSEQTQILTDIRRALEEIKGILTLVHQGDLDRAKKVLLKEGSVKQKVYDLCDGTRTTKDLAESIGKDVSYVSSYLTILRREGLVRTIDKEDKQIHEQVF